MMTKKIFEEMAAAFGRVCPKPADYKTQSAFEESYGAWCRAVVAISDVCERDNVNFDRDKFYEACDMWSAK